MSATARLRLTAHGRRVLDGRFLLAVLLLWTLLRAVSAVILHQLAHHHQDPVVYDEPDVPLYFQFATLWDSGTNGSRRRAARRSCRRGRTGRYGRTPGPSTRSSRCWPGESWP